MTWNVPVPCMKIRKLLWTEILSLQGIRVICMHSGESLLRKSEQEHSKTWTSQNVQMINCNTVGNAGLMQCGFWGNRVAEMIELWVIFMHLPIQEQRACGCGSVRLLRQGKPKGKEGLEYIHFPDLWKIMLMNNKAQIVKFCGDLFKDMPFFLSEFSFQFVPRYPLFGCFIV